MVGEKLEQVVKFFPAWDKRSPDPKKNYGIHCVELLMLLKGEKGAVQFKLFTNWNLPQVQKETDAKYLINPDKKIGLCLYHPMPADLGYHSKVPRWEGQEPISQECEYTGGPCYYDGSGLNAQRIYEVLTKEGSDGVWRELEAYYKRIFEEASTHEQK